MELELHSIFRLKGVLIHSGFSGKGPLYRAVNDGTWTPPVHISPRCVGWPASEIAALNAARIAGWSDDEIRQLVKNLIIKRKALVVPGKTA